jgi:hypothetical protein
LNPRCGFALSGSRRSQQRPKIPAFPGILALTPLKPRKASRKAQFVGIPAKIDLDSLNDQLVLFLASGVEHAAPLMP